MTEKQKIDERMRLYRSETLLEQIRKVLEDAVWVQENGSSQYTREHSKVVAYEEIAELMGFKQEEG